MEYIPAKTIVNRTKDTSWFGTDYNMNIYKGCCHGCIYCDSRSECYHVEEFDRVRAKENALEVIRNDLRRKVRTGVIGTGAMSDPYNPFEGELMLTRRALELVDAYGFGIAIATKSTLVTRDIDILSDIKSHSPTLVKVTVTAADDALSKAIEPNAPPSSKRFEAIRTLSQAGIFTGVLLMPVLPFIEDSDENVLAIVSKAHECGARFIYPAFGMTLRQNQRDWYYEKLGGLFPGQGLVERYQKRYGERYTCTSPRAKALWGVFKEACDRYGILYNMTDIVNAYKLGYADSQLSFF
ncbi:SPL family radical SAM protein [Acetanaerobacterium elongatum]|uniref:DNA repair photolyase n=1 Tax=Acetanaerobacterium elongatum TaxID=258515 RepID=A0A1H0H6P3_9FIRM|nr:radical SAM protein [Acetanaerobacterium elongatum]SDO14808.1 DNA repair photolyase [Acetanaerobacterium elongatum]